MAGNPHRFIDTHCHLDFEVFAQSLESDLHAWRQCGLKAYVVPAVARRNWARVKALAAGYSGVYAALGLHPYFVSEHSEADLAALEQEVMSAGSDLVALGELGLDARQADLNIQRHYLDAQLELARQFELPVMVHSVKTHSQVLASLKRASIARGVIHAFSGSRQEAEQFVSAGFSIGVGAVICYQRAQKTRAAIATLPLSALLLETDAPDMPLPGRQKGSGNCEDLLTIFAALCDLRSESPSLIAETVFQNSLDLFGIQVASV